MHHRIAPPIAMPVLALALAASPANAQEAATGTTVEPDRSAYRAGTVQEVGIPLSGVELGLGWDSRRGEVVPNRCIEFAPVQTRGQATSLKLTEVSDQSELMQSLNVNAAVSVRTIFASGDAKSSFAKSSKVKASSTNLVVQATVDNGVLFAGPKRSPDRARYANPQLGERGELAPDWGWSQWANDPGTNDLHSLTFRPWASEWLEANDAAAFRRHCGDSFVASIDSGAELLALISFTASSAEERRKIAASVRADFGVVHASASASSENNSSRQNSNLEVTVSQIGGSGGPIATSREDLVEKLKLLAMDAAMAPKFHSMQVVSYDSLADWPAGLPLTASTGEQEIIADTYWFLSSYYDQLEEIIADPAAYSYATGLIPSELRDLQDQVLEKRAGLLAGLREAAAGEVPAAAMLASVALPVPGDGMLTFPEAVDPGLLGAESGLPAAAAWVDALGASLGEELPLGNPNTLLLHLPLPRAATATLLRDEAALRALVVRRHLHDQAKRFCRLDPSDNQCLTNAELQELEELVTVNRNTLPANQRLQNIGSGLCLFLERGANAFVTADCAERPADRSVFDAVGSRVRLTVTGTCLLVQGGALGFAAPCDGGNEWVFTELGEIRVGDQCLTATGRDQPVAVATCATDAPARAAATAASDRGPADAAAAAAVAAAAALPLNQAWRPLDHSE
jgi:hypothetical protein